MASILNLPTFVKNGGHFFYHGNAGLAEKGSIYVLLSKTHSTVWAEKNCTSYAKKSYRAAVSL